MDIRGDDERPRRFADLVLRTPPNWTAVGFFGLLGAMHLSISIPALLVGRWEGYLSLVFGSLFAIGSLVSYGIRSEVGFFPRDGRVRLRTGTRRFFAERSVGFNCVRAVRVTLPSPGSDAGGSVELLCACEGIECPPTRVPRQEALLLAMMLDVPLVKVRPADEPRTSPAGAGQPAIHAGATDAAEASRPRQA